MTAPATVVFTLFFFFNDTATTEIYTLSLHDALPIFRCGSCAAARSRYLTSICGCAARHRDTISRVRVRLAEFSPRMLEDRKSTRLNSSHSQISYAVFCLKKKKKMQYIHAVRVLTRDR